jgi:glutathione peroxidase
LLLWALLPIFASTTRAEAARDFAQELYSQELKDIDGKPVQFSDYKGKVLMIVNTASECGFTPQFQNLTELQKKFGDQGFQVLAFPSNDFKQDKGSDEEVKKFAQEKYKINFPLFDKASVSGDKKQALYKILVSQRSDLFNEVQWNFEKFIVNRQGLVVDRFRSMTKPDDSKVVELIEKLLKEKKEK